MAHENGISIGGISLGSGVGIGPFPIIEKEDLGIDTEGLCEQLCFASERSVEGSIAGGPPGREVRRDDSCQAMGQEALFSIGR